MMEVEEQFENHSGPNVEDFENDSMMAFGNEKTSDEASCSGCGSNVGANGSMATTASSSKQSYETPSLMWNSANSLSTMYKMRPNLCDVCFLTEDGHRIFAHRVVLASTIPYFSTMFVGSDFSVESDSTEIKWNLAYNVNYVEQKQYEIPIKNVDGRSLNEIIKYCYMGVINITEDTVQTLMSTATMLNCADIITICSEYLKTKLQAINALGICSFAELMGCLELKEYAFSFILNNFVQISSPQNEEFLNLTPDRLVEIISSDFLDTGKEGEHVVLSAVINWISVNPVERRPHLSQLIKHIRFPKFSQEALLNIENDFPLIKSESAAKDLLIEALKYHLYKTSVNSSTLHFCQSQTFSELNLESPFDSKDVPPRPCVLQDISQVFDLSNSRFRERIPRIRQKCLVVVGGQAPKAVRHCEYFNFSTNKWSEFVWKLPSKRCRFGIAIVNGLIYAIGGFNGEFRVRTVDVFDPKLNQWSKCASLEARRSTLGACVLDGLIYAIGGFDGTIGLQSAEVYNPITRSWRSIASMSTRRSSVAVAALNGLLYAVGGYDGASRQCLSSVECYSPELNKWTNIGNMSQRRSGAGVCILDGKLYAIGGHDGPAVRKSVECYDPETQVWTQCADMFIARRNAGVVAKDHLLYVIGGEDGQSNLSSVEVYDPKVNRWSILTQGMQLRRSYAGVAIVDKTWP